MKLTLMIVSALSSFLATDVEGLRARVNGGEDAKVGQFKYIVGIEIKHGFFSDSSYCTGSIIDKKFILTAAHCFTKDEKNKDGTHSRKFEKTEVVVYANVIGLDKEYRKATHADKKKAVSVYFVPEYLKNGIADIAVLELDSDLSFSEGLLEKLQRPGPSIHGIPPGSPNLYEDTEGVIAGYGQNKVGKNNNKLKWINMKTVSYMECRKKYENEGFIDQKRFVCGKGDHSPLSGCPGDSGAPLVVNHNEVRKPKVVIGVLSHGASCSDKENNPNVFIRVSHYEDFIFNAIKKADKSPRVAKYEFKK